MPRLPHSLPRQLGTVFTRREAIQAGVGSRRLVQQDVERVFEGVYRRRDRLPRPPQDLTPAEVVVWQHRTLAEQVGAHLPAGHFFSGRTAAALWSLPVTLKPRDALEVAVFAPQRASVDPAFAARKVLPRLARVVQHHGVFVIDPATTWAMLAPSISFDDGVALGDAVIRRPRIPGTKRLKRQPLGSIEELQAVATHRHRPGAPQLRALLPKLVTQCASPAESRLRLRLEEWGLMAPALDYDVFDEDGQLLGCSEFAYPKLRLALEYEGAQHLTKTAQWNRDITKYQHYTQVGWEVIRVTSLLLHIRQDELRWQISEAIERRTRQLRTGMRAA